MNILFVDCCISQREIKSRTRILCNSFLNSIKMEYEDADIKIRNLSKTDLRPFDTEMLNKRDQELIDKRFDSDIYSLAREFRDADGIVVGAPFWDLSFPSLLRIYIEHISANGITYHYDESGPHGDCKAKWLVYITSGGDAERQQSLGVEYWRQLTRMYGIDDFEYVFAGGLDLQPENAAEIVAENCMKCRRIASRL